MTEQKQIDIGLLDPKEYPLYSLSGIITIAQCWKVYDGDSFRILINLNGKYVNFKCRLNGLDTPELRTHNTLEKKIALQAKLFVQERIENKVVRVRCGDWDKYGRLLVSVTLLDGKEHGMDLSTLLINNRLAFAYNGKTKRKDWENL